MVQMLVRSPTRDRPDSWLSKFRRHTQLPSILPIILPEIPERSEFRAPCTPSGPPKLAGVLGGKGAWKNWRWLRRPAPRSLVGDEPRTLASFYWLTAKLAWRCWSAPSLDPNPTVDDFTQSNAAFVGHFRECPTPTLLVNTLPVSSLINALSENYRAPHRRARPHKSPQPLPRASPSAGGISRKTSRFQVPRTRRL